MNEETTQQVISSLLTTDLVTLSIMLIMTMLGKTLATKIAAGIMFKMNPLFKEGERVYVDREEAIIINKGFFTTQFEIINAFKGDNDKEQRLWRYVPSDKIDTIKLSKIK